MAFFVGHVLPCAAVYRFHNRSSVSAGGPTPEHRRRARRLLVVVQRRDKGRRCSISSRPAAPGARPFV